MRSLNLLDGKKVNLADAAGRIGPVVISAEVACQAGQVDLLINKRDGTSAYLTDRRSAMAGAASTSNTWVHLGEEEYFRTVSLAVEGTVGGFVRIQKSSDGGKSWTEGDQVFESADLTMYEYGGWYDKPGDRGFVPCLIGADNSKFSLYLFVYTDRMTKLSAQVLLHDASSSPWYRMTQGRLIELSSGTLVLPVYSSTDLFTSMDSPSGVFRCASGSDPGLASSWSYVNGSGCGSARGMIECQAVEMPDGNLMIEANTRTGFLVRQVWKNDALLPGPSTITEFVSPRSKADLIQLSSGGYAKVWCSVEPTGDREGPRTNAVLAFSDDLRVWHDFHVVALGVFVYELYLQEIAGKLRVRYWDWPTPGVGNGLAYDKFFNLNDRQELPCQRMLPASVLRDPASHDASMVAVIGPAVCDIEGVLVSGKPKSDAIFFTGGGRPLTASEEGAFRVLLPGGDVACF